MAGGCAKQLGVCLTPSQQLQGAQPQAPGAATPTAPVWRWDTRGIFPATAGNPAGNPGRTLPRISLGIPRNWRSGVWLPHMRRLTHLQSASAWEEGRAGSTGATQVGPAFRLLAVPTCQVRSCGRLMRSRESDAALTQLAQAAAGSSASICLARHCRVPGSVHPPPPIRHSTVQRSTAQLSAAWHRHSAAQRTLSVRLAHPRRRQISNRHRMMRPADCTRVKGQRAGSGGQLPWY